MNYRNSASSVNWGEEGQEAQFTVIRKSIHRGCALSVPERPIAVSRDFIGNVWVFRRDRDGGCWEINIDRGAGRREDGTPFTITKPQKVAEPETVGEVSMKTTLY